MSNRRNALGRGIGALIPGAPAHVSVEAPPPRPVEDRPAEIPVDAIDANLVEALPDMRHRIILVDVTVHREPVSFGAGAGEDVLELDGRIVLFVGVQSHPDDPIPMMKGLFESLHR